MNFSTDILKNIQKHPKEATPGQIRALAYLFVTTAEVLMLRNQQCRATEQRLLEVLQRSLSSQRRATNYARKLVFWQLMTLIFASGLIGSWLLRLGEMS